MSDLAAISVILIETGVLVAIGLFLTKIFAGLVASYLEEKQQAQHQVKPRKRVIIFLKKQAINEPKKLD
jgi:hypothetical protein